MKILHTGDWHIGNFPGPEKDNANMRLTDIISSIEKIIEQAKLAKPDIILISGDLFHQAKVWSDRGLQENQIVSNLLTQFSEIAPVVAMRGTPNHDSEEQFKTLANRFKNTNVHIITEPQIDTYTLNNGKQLQVACIPGFDKGYYRSQYPGIDKENENILFTQSIKTQISDLGLLVNPAIPSVFMTHFTVPGSNMSGGQTTFFEKIEPVVHADTLENNVFNLCCLGHIHMPQQICPTITSKAFYSGSACQLNFNDENQPHGFYMHYINDTTNAYEYSEFIQIPSREFLTINLSQNDIETFNDKGEAAIAHLLPSVTDKIIRVLYTCTDETNKNFDKAKLEKCLYKHNAFFVQEVTPQDVTVTQNKKIMSNSTPEDNLTDYLIEKNFDAAQIADIMALARPIIDECNATQTQSNNGTFTPVAIEVQNYRNYRNEIFSFEPIQYCTINGNNGVGKSSLFMDAILDALFEEPREGELTGWITNDASAKSGSIKFTFDIGSRRFRVTRTRTKSGKATLNLSELVNGQWENRSKEKYRDTQKEIDNLIGMNSLTLKACALIMQDQYGLFLQADKEARMTVLGTILGLNSYQTMHQLASDKTTETNREVRRIKDEIAILSEDVQDIDKLNADIFSATNNSKLTEKAMQETIDKLNGLKIVISTQNDITANIEKLNKRNTAAAAKIAAKTADKAAEETIVNNATAILAEEPAIIAGINEYHKLQEEEKANIANVTAYNNLAAQKTMLNNTLLSYQTETQTLTAEKQQLEKKKADTLAILAKEPALTASHAEYTKTKDEIAALQSQMARYNEIQDIISRLTNSGATMNTTYSRISAELKQTLANLTQKTKLLEDSNCPHIENATCRFLADAMTAKAQIPEIQEKIRINDEQYNTAQTDLKTKLSAAQADFDKIKSTPDTIVALQTKLNSLSAAETEYQTLDIFRKNLDDIQNQLQHNQKKADENQTNINKTNSEISAITEKMIALGPCISQKAEIETKLHEASKWLTKEKELLTARERQTKALSIIAGINNEINLLIEEQKEIANDIMTESAKRIDTTSINNRIAELTAYLTSQKTEYNNYLTEISRLVTQLETTKKKQLEIDKLTKDLADVSKNAAIYEELKKAFSQNGIPHNIIRSIIPSLESTASNILSQMSGGNMNVEFVTEKTLKSNSKKEVITLDIIINDSVTGRLPYMSRSGGERVKAALSVILALAEIKSKTAGIQLGFLFIDEPPFLDGPGVQAYCDALETIQRRYNSLKIMAITHDPSMKNRFMQSVDIVKTDTGSHIVI